MHYITLNYKTKNLAFARPLYSPPKSGEDEFIVKKKDIKFVIFSIIILL